MVNNRQYLSPLLLGGLLLVCSLGAWAANNEDAEVINAEPEVIDAQDSQTAQEPAAESPPSTRPRAAARPPRPLSDMSDSERLERLERLWENGGLAEAISRLEAMQQEMQRLQGEAEVQAHKLEELQNGQREAAKDFDRRLRQIEQASGNVPAPPPSLATSPVQAPAASADTGSALAASGETAPAASLNTATAPPADTPPPSAAANTPDAASAEGGEQAAYQQAFDALKAGRYEKASAGFSDFLARYPNAENAPNAQYWMGEAQYVKRSYKEAQQSFQTLLERYPATPRRAEATLKLGFIHYELNEWDEARKTLTDVRNNFPDSTAAKLAENRLQKMKKEGH